MTRIALAWYGWLSGLAQGPALALQGWADRVELPLFDGGDGHEGGNS